MQNKKKLFALAIAGLIAVVAIAGGTLAFFSDAQRAENVFTLGNVKIDLSEPNYKPDIPSESGGEVTNVLPNATIEKDPTISVKEGSSDAYIRAEIVIESRSEGFTLTREQMDELLAGLDIQNGWTRGEGGYYYYDKKLSAGQSQKLFTKVTFPSNWGNQFANKTIALSVSAQAIQADNFSPERDDANAIIGWGGIQIES